MNFLLAAEVYFANEISLNRGILLKDYWQNQNLSLSSPKVIGIADTKLGINFMLGQLEMVIEKRKLQTLSSNTNSLHIASVPESNFKDTKNGKYEISGILNTFEYHSIGIKTTKKQDYYNSYLSITPKLIKLNNYKIQNGYALLDINGDNKNITGNLFVQDEKQFGYLANPQEKQIGIGGGLDFDTGININNNSFKLEANNLYSSIPLRGGYYKDLSYRINTNSGKIIYSEIPSLTGSYGQLDKDLHLPKLIKISFENKGFLSENLSESLGIICTSEGNIYWAELGYKHGANILKIKTYEFQNLYVTLEKKNIFIENFNIGLTLVTTLHSKVQTLLGSIQYLF